MIENSEASVNSYKVVDIKDVLPFGVQHLVFVCKGLNRNERLNRNSSQIKENGQLGGIEQPVISQGEILDINVDSDSFGEPSSLVHEFLQDPRGIARIEGARFLVSSIDSVFLIDFKTDHIIRVPTDTDPWMCFIHHLYLSGNKDRLLVTSSGNETIYEYAIDHASNMLALKRKWCAWENGFTKPLSLESDVINSSRKQIGIPPGQRTVFPNSTCYIDEDHILSTFFHRGLFKINLNSGSSTEIFKGKYFHTIQPFRSGYVFASSREGKIYYLDTDLQSPKVLLDFTSLPGLDVLSEGKEWIQSVHVLDDNRLLVVDSNRAHFYVIDIENKKFSITPYQPNLVIQEVLDY